MRKHLLLDCGGLAEQREALESQIKRNNQRDEQEILSLSRQQQVLWILRAGPPPVLLTQRQQSPVASLTLHDGTERRNAIKHHITTRENAESDSVMIYTKGTTRREAAGAAFVVLTNGNRLLAMSCKIRACPPLEAELTAIAKALEWAADTINSLRLYSRKILAQKLA